MWADGYLKAERGLECLERVDRFMIPNMIMYYMKI
jgi:hypothetical protein